LPAPGGMERPVRRRPRPPRILRRPAWRARHAHAPAAARRRVVDDVGPYRVHALEAGSGAECVVLLHGLSGSSRWWHRTMDAFARRYRVLVPDVVGFGRTRCPGPLPGIPELAAILGEWMEMRGARGAHVVGHSMGGQLAVHLAAARPDLVSRLVLVDAAGIRRPVSPATVLRFAREVAPPVRWGDPVFLPVIVRDALTAGPRNILRALRHILADDVRPLLPRITAPTLVLWGGRDTIVPVAHAADFRAGIPGARLIVLPRAAHNPMVDRPGEFNRAVLRFLAGRAVGE
jgi:pimeloyl-ACP methyl ester carboxylesterase